MNKRQERIERVIGWYRKIRAKQSQYGESGPNFWREDIQLNFDPICKCDENGEPMLSEKEKTMEAVAEEITQLLRERNLTAREAIDVLDIVNSTISRIIAEKLF